MIDQTRTTLYVHSPVVDEVRRVDSKSTDSGKLFIVPIGGNVTLTFNSAAALKAFISDLSTKRAELPVSV